MSSQFNLQGFKEFKTPNLPESIEKSFGFLEQMGASTVKQTQDLLGSAKQSIRDIVPGMGSGNNNNNNNNSVRPVDFKSLANANEDEDNRIKYSGDTVFGGLLNLEGLTTLDYKSPCAQDQYDREITEQLRDIKEQQQLMEYLFSKTGALLNFHPNQNGIFVRKQLTANCSPTPVKSQPKSRKQGESCVRDTDCITTSTENKPLCKKAIRDQYLTGICDEILKREGKKCNATKDCKNSNLECVNKKCTRKVNRLAGQASSFNTSKAPRVNTNIPLQNFKGLGFPTPNKKLDSYYSATPYGSYSSKYGF